MFKKAIVFLALFSIFSIECKELTKGSKAPSFSLRGDDNVKHSLADYKGKKIVLFFYPKDGSPDCTKEAIGFKDNIALFDKNNIVILGVSHDSVEKHKAFKEKFGFPFTLLSDPKSKTIEKYGAKGLIFNSRKTFIIDENGNIDHIFNIVTAKDHAQEVIDYLKLK